MNDSTMASVDVDRKFVFLVEDDEDLRADLEHALQVSGYTAFSF